MDAAPRSRDAMPVHHERSADTDKYATWLLRSFAIVLFATLALTSLLMTGPLIHGDEGSYLLNAAAIAGKLKSSLSAGYYSGYSLLIVPGFLLFDDFASIFHYTLVVNAALIASLPFALRRILQCVAPDAGPAWHALGAAAASCQLAILASAPLALSENLLIPLYAWMLAGGAAMLMRRERRAAVCCGIAAGMLFLTHPRGAMMALPVLLALSLPCAHERSLRSVVVWMWLCAALVAALHVPLEWLAEKTAGAQNDTYSLRFLLSRYVSLHTWLQAIVNAFGALSYIAIATFGVVVLALLQIVRQLAAAWQQRAARLDAADAISLALLLGLLTSILVTAVYLNPPTRADHMIYGRYTLPTFIPVLALGLTCLRFANHGRPPQAWWAVAATFACIGAMGLAFLLLPHPPANSWVHVNILDLYIPFALAGRIDWPTIGFYFSAVAFVIYSAACLGFGKSCAVLFTAFNIAVAAYITIDSTLPANAMRGRERQATSVVREFERATGTPLCISIALEIDNWHALDYQNWLFDRISESAVVDRKRCIRGIIATLSTKRPSGENFRLVSTDLNNPYGLFVQKSAALDAFAASHALPPEDFPAALAQSERFAQVDLIGIADGTQLRTGRPFGFSVRITHAGGNVVWPARFDGTPLLAIRAGARLDPLDGGDPHIEYRADLSGPLKPGESTTVQMSIGPIDKPGRYSVDVGVLQEGIAWFDTTRTVTISAIDP